MTEKKLALFDFDGTITTADTFLLFIKYTVGRLRYNIGFISLSPFVLLFYTKLLSAGRLKEIFLKHYFKSWSKKRFEDACNLFVKGELYKVVKDSALASIKWHKDNGHRVIVVSASPENWLAPWCKDQGVELIATKIKDSSDLFTGKLSSPNCNGKEKVVRIKSKVNLEDYTYIYAYGNSSGDREMLELANEGHMNNFK